LVNLIPRFYTPTSGQILIDGIDIQEMRLADLRANMSLVTQDVMLFNDSIAANVAYGAGHSGAGAGATRDDVVAAARAAHVMDFVEHMPEGLETLIGDNG